MKNVTFEQVIEKEMESFIYKPITKEESLGKTIDKILTFYSDAGFTAKRKWLAIIFTDKTALFLDGRHNATTYFSCLTMSYTDEKTGAVKAWIRDDGTAFIEQGLCDENILEEAVLYLKAFRESQRDTERKEEAERLKARLKELEK